MKKFVILMLFLAVFPCLVFADFSDGETRLGLGFGMPNTTLLFQTGAYDIKLGYDFTENKEYFFISPSFMLINSRHIFSVFSATLAIGGFAKFFFEDEFRFMGGLNLPFSIEAAFFDGFLEFFATVAPGLELYPKPAVTLDALCWWLGFTLKLD